MKQLTVLYDGECELCKRCRTFFTNKPAYISLKFIALQTPDLEQQFPGVHAFHPDKEIIVISDEGGVYQGGFAWIMCLYALKEYREWSFRLANPALLPFAKRIVSSVSHNRYFLSSLLPKSETEFLHSLDKDSVSCGGEN